MYYVVFAALWLLSLLPFKALYFISDIIAFILYHLVRYRKQVVLDNLFIAFPEKTEEERKQIAKQFYRNFTDSMVETIKLISISKKQLQQRNSINTELIIRLLNKGRNINLLCGHQFNWEYANLAYSAVSTVPFITVYLPVANKIFNRVMFRIRSRFGAMLVSPEEFGTRMHHVFKEKYSLVLAADQSPAAPRSGYWLNFFSRPAPFLIGPEKSAVRQRSAVVFFGFKKIKRGHYHFEPVLITDDASLMPGRGELTRCYRDLLEKSLREDPANYLWSHRRWKHTWDSSYQKLWIDLQQPANDKEQQ